MDHKLYRVAEFCAAHGISKPYFYRLVAQGRGPQVIRLGRRTLISEEAAIEWRAKLAAQSPTTTAR